MEPHENMKRYLEIIEAKDVGNLCVLLTFNDGVQQTVDIGSFILKHPHPMYDRYLDSKIFAKFKLEGGNIYWGKNEALIFPVGALYKGNLELCCDEV